MNFREEECTGDYANCTYPMGEFSGTVFLGGGKKRVRILFPHSVTAEIIQMELTDASILVPVKREKRLVAYGDSITQGFDVLHPAHTYAVRLADALDMALCNKALGGAIFTPPLADAAEDTGADMILVACGTNDWGGHTVEAVRANADVTVVSGWELVPHEEAFFGDLSLHPNDVGFAYYCENLLKKLPPL